MVCRISVITSDLVAESNLTINCIEMTHTVHERFIDDWYCSGIKEYRYETKYRDWLYGSFGRKHYFCSEYDEFWKPRFWHDGFR